MKYQHELKCPCFASLPIQEDLFISFLSKWRLLLIFSFLSQSLFLSTNQVFETLVLQGQQGLSGHFEMALTGRKKVAKSKLMVASNSQQRHIFRHMVSFYVPIKSWPQWPHILQKPLRKRVDIGHSIPVTSDFVKLLRPGFDRYIKTDHMSKNVPLLAVRGYH